VARSIDEDVNNLAAVLSLVLSFGSACAFEEGWEEGDFEEEIGDLDLEGRVVNGRVINGRVINGRLINGTGFSGSIASVSLSHVLLGATYVNASLVKSKFSSGKVTGSAFNGAVFDATLSDGNVIPIKITSVRQAATDLWAYKVSYQSEAGWSPYCLDAAGLEVEAYPLNGVWNLGEGLPGGGMRTAVSGKFTFACRVTGALGKCVDFGYVPWRAVGTTSLLTYHDTCVRAVRADWCGDGRAWTVDGTTINLWDRKAVQVDSETWPAEAEWGAMGATCLNKTRVVNGELRGELIPDCAKARQTLTCGAGLTNANSASLEITERLLQ
jgi:hypothetical protein